MIMNFNFNYKKFFKYLLLFIFIYFFVSNFSSAKAMEIVNGSVLNVTDTDFLLKGVWNNGTIDDAITFNYNSHISDLRDTLHTRAITQTNSTDFSDFESNFYYAIVLSYNHNNSGNKTIYMNLYYRSKIDGDFHFNFNFWSTTALTSSTSIINGSFYPNVPSNQLSVYGATIRADGSNYYTSTAGYQNNWEFHKNSTGSYYGSFSYSNNQFNLSLDNFLTKTDTSIATQFYIDSNISSNALYFDSLNYIITANRYNFESMNLTYFENGNANLTSYSLGAIILDYFSIEPPNIQNLGNNSVGVNVNSISNILFDYSNNSSTIIECPSERAFIGDVCYIYEQDISNFDSSNTNINNSAIWYLGNSSSNSISLDSSKYYVLSFRIYTNYNLDIFTTIYHLKNDSTDYSFNIISKYFQDNVLYKDYAIVFQPTHTGSHILTLFNIVFSNLKDLTNNYSVSFGVFKTFKLSEYLSIPSQEQVQDELNINSLTTISSNINTSFFNRFKVNNYGLSSIVAYPLAFARSFNDYTCNSLILPIPHLTNVSLPCVSDIMYSNVPTIWILFRIIINGIFIYKILISFYSLVKNSSSPDNDRIEVVDL